MKVNFREPSTKRGIVMTITGGIVLYQLFWGSGNADVDRILARVDWWLGIGLTLVGMLGLLPDRDPQQRTRATDQPSPLPPIDLVGKSESTPSIPEILIPQFSPVDANKQKPSTSYYNPDSHLCDHLYDDPDDVVTPLKPTEVKPEDSSGWNG